MADLAINPSATRAVACGGNLLKVLDIRDYKAVEAAAETTVFPQATILDRVAWTPDGQVSGRGGRGGVRGGGRGGVCGWRLGASVGGGQRSRAPPHLFPPTSSPLDSAELTPLPPPSSPLPCRWW